MLLELAIGDAYGADLEARISVEGAVTMIDTLENDTYGRDYLIALDKQLMALVAKS